MEPINPHVDGEGICNQNFAGPKDLITPAGMGCDDLPVFVSRDTGELMSFWAPDAAELAALNAGQVVVLRCVGVQPICSIHVTTAIDPLKPGGL